MDWISEHWWQAALVIFAFLGLRELAAIRQAAENVQSMMGSLRDVKAERERGQANREEYGTLKDSQETR